jgi:glutamate-ammonia-ligase adenylyltransferase
MTHDDPTHALTTARVSLSLPAPLSDLARQWLAETGLHLDPPFDSRRLAELVGCSPYSADVLRRYPDLLDPKGAAAEPLSPEQPEADFVRQLRLRRHAGLVRILLEETAGYARLDSALAALSALADEMICAALAWTQRSLAQRHGIPRDSQGEESRPAILAMGKLGGCELNFSSDVDLVFLYSSAGETDGPRRISNEEYFRLLVHRIVSLLARTTGDGFVYRVDLRLRPFGDSGPPAVSLPAFESYLMQHGRDWERYAYIKARVVNDWPEARQLYDDVLRPFVYRRYLDYGVFEALREMKAMIEGEVARREFQSNLKLGPGGIREIEFIVQSMQLIRGGTQGELRGRSLLAILERLGNLGHLETAVVGRLAEAYRFLRALENRIQALHDRQTHDVPAEEIDRQRIAFGMGFAGWEPLARSLEENRANVAADFRQLVFRSEDGRQTPGDASLPALWSAEISDEAASAAFQAVGFPDAQSARDRLRQLRLSGPLTRLDEPGRQRLAALMPALIAIAGRQTQPLRSLDNVATVIEAIGRRSAYFSLLNENPAARERLVSLCGRSGFLAEQLAAHPVLLDELLDPRRFSELPTRDELSADLATRLREAGTKDTERELDALRSFRQAAVFRVAVADLSGVLPLMKVSDRLTDTAELFLGAALDMAWQELRSRHGEPQIRVEGIPGPLRAAAFSIVAYGKLGGLELGYGSDLDLVFLHNSEGEFQETSGPARIDNGEFFAKLARRIISIATMRTNRGPLYDVDTRLRPSGRAGLLVSTLSAFEHYQREDAWTWEHQALLRSRFVAGDARVGNAFEEVRTRVLTTFVRRDRLRDDVSAMRAKMHSELARGNAEHFDIKHDRGGITDIEFIVQFLVLRESRKHPDLARYSDNIRQLEAIARHGILPPVDVERLTDTYKAFRGRLHHLALAGEEGFMPCSEAAASAGFVKALWADVIGG